MASQQKTNRVKKCYSRRFSDSPMSQIACLNYLSNAVDIAFCQSLLFKSLFQNQIVFKERFMLYQNQYTSQKFKYRKQTLLDQSTYFKMNEPQKQADIRIGSVTLNLQKICKRSRSSIFQKNLYFQENCIKGIPYDNVSFGSISINHYPLIVKADQEKLELHFFLKYKNWEINPKKIKTNLNKNILKGIIHISFPNLIVLKVFSQKLNNIEGISLINAPKIKLIQLYDCQIVSVKPLAKTNFPELQTITLYENHINELNSLCRGSFNKLAKYQIDASQDYRTDRSKQHVTENYFFLFKMRNNQVNKLKLSSKKRINVSKQKKQLVLRMSKNAEIVAHQSFNVHKRYYCY